jgi:uncharacterized protein YkwD
MKDKGYTECTVGLPRSEADDIALTAYAATTPEQSREKARIAAKYVRFNRYPTWKRRCSTCDQVKQGSKKFGKNAGEGLLYYVNLGRRKHGLQPVRLDPELMRSAQAKADDMHDRHYFDHMDLEGNMPRYAENLINGSEFLICHEAFRSWSASTGHHDNMMNPKWTRMGIGYRLVVNERLMHRRPTGSLWVQHFA